MARTRLRRRRRRVGAALFVAALVAVSLSIGSAYTSAATGARGGEGLGGISGYTVSGVQFQLGSGDAVQAVAFHLSPATARTVRVRLSAGGPWLSCTVSGAAARCPLAARSGAASLDQLSVVAY